MYPSWLVSSMLYCSSDMVKGFMTSQPSGTFCFVKAYKRADGPDGNPMKRKYAMHHAHGNKYLADAMMKSEDRASVIIVAKDGGAMRVFNTPSSNLSRFATLDAFIADFSMRTGIPATKETFLDSAGAYGVAL